MFLLSSGSFLRAVCEDLVKKLSSNQLIKECVGQVVLICVSEVRIKQWFEYGFLRLIERMETKSTLVLVVASLLCEIDWNVPWSQDWFSYDYETGKLSFVGIFAPMISKLVDSTGKETDWTVWTVPFIMRNFLRVARHFDSPKRLGSCTWIRKWIISGFGRLKRKRR